MDQLVRGSSLGALPLNQNMKQTKLKFGELLGEGGERTGHLAFGFEGEVLELERNGVYT